MRDKGLSEEEIENLLDSKLAEDLDYSSGKILGSMCTEPIEFANRIYAKYLCKNIGDRGLFPATSDLEHELICELGNLFNCDQAYGNITSGGSESNIIAMRIAKKLRPDVNTPEIVVPASAHLSFYKAGDMMGLEIKPARLKSNLELDLDHFKSLISENTIAIVGVAGTTINGLIDPIEEMGEIAEEKHLYFHVDAAFGGFVLPFLQDLGYDIPLWDFSVEQVHSLTADPHKMGLSIIPSGGFVIRGKSHLEKLGFEITYLAGGAYKHLNILGTRPGAAVIAFWALMQYLGREGYRNIVKECMENTFYLEQRINEIPGIKIPTKPVMNVIGISPEKPNLSVKLDEELRKQRYMLGLFKNYNLLRMCLMPHVKREHIDTFCQDLEIILKKIQ